jgi:hypothetical protein
MGLLAPPPSTLPSHPGPAQAKQLQVTLYWDGPSTLTGWQQLNLALSGRETSPGQDVLEVLVIFASKGDFQPLARHPGHPPQISGPPCEFLVTHRLCRPGRTRPHSAAKPCPCTGPEHKVGHLAMPVCGYPQACTPPQSSLTPPIHRDHLDPGLQQASCHTHMPRLCFCHSPRSPGSSCSGLCRSGRALRAGGTF